MDKKTREFFESVLNEEPYSPDSSDRLTLKQAINAMKSPENWSAIVARISKQSGIKGFFKNIKDQMDIANGKMISYFSSLGVLIKSKFKQTEKMVAKKEVLEDKVEKIVEEKLVDEVKEPEDDIQKELEKAPVEKTKEEKVPEDKKEEVKDEEHLKEESTKSEKGKKSTKKKHKRKES